VPSKIIASGGIRDIADIQALCGMGLYGAICGKSIYQGSLDLRNALEFVAKAKKIN
jgi:phosphoribosylformimino-5-aminoimidazole carboxamide ribotide isomerase